MTTRLELVWPNKDKFLLVPRDADGKPVWVEPTHPAALALCYGAIDGAEAARDGREPAPWYTEQAAIIHRKLGQRDEEIAVLQRWLRACPPDRRATSGIQARLDKLLAKRPS